MIKKLLPKIVHYLFVRRFRVSLRPKWYEELEKLGTIEKSTVSRKDGSIACAKITTPQSNGKKIVILAHPIARKGKFYYNEGVRVRMFLELGYQVVIFDFNGFGESTPIDLFYWRDTAAVIKYYASISEQLVFYGISFGAYHSIRSFSALPQGAFIVMENVNPSLYDTVTTWSKSKWFVAFYHFVHKLNLAEVNDLNVIQSLQELDRQDLSFLLIAGEKDNMAPEAQMCQILEYIPGWKKIVVIENAEHMKAHLVDSQNYALVVKDFLQSAL